MVTADEKAAREKDDQEQREAVEGIIRLQRAAARTKYCEELTRCLTNHLETEQMAHGETKMALQDAQKTISERDAEIRTLRHSLKLREEEYAYAQKEINQLMLRSATMSLGTPAFEELQFLKSKNAHLQAELRLKDSKLEQIRRRHPTLEDVDFVVPHFAIQTENYRQGNQPPQSSPLFNSKRDPVETVTPTFQAATPADPDHSLRRVQVHEKKTVTESTSSAHHSDDQELSRDPGPVYKVDDQPFGFAATAKFSEALRQLTLNAERRLLTEDVWQRLSMQEAERGGGGGGLGAGGGGGLA